MLQWAAPWASLAMKDRGPRPKIWLKTVKRNLDNLLNDSDRSSSEFNKQQNIIVYYTPPGGHPSEAIPHSLSWSKEPKLTASCFPDILQNDRNGPSQVRI